MSSAHWRDGGMFPLMSSTPHGWMLRAMQTPDDLDAEGILLWTSLIETRQRERVANAAYRTARQALRSQPLTATPNERATASQRYRDAVVQRDETSIDRQAAER